MGKYEIYAVDFDGTLCEEKWPDIGEPNRPLIFKLIRLRKAGDKIILNTMREGDLLCQAVEWCRRFGLEFDAVNDNLEEEKRKFNNNPRKIYAQYYIDDHNARGGVFDRLPFRKE